MMGVEDWAEIRRSATSLTPGSLPQAPATMTTCSRPLQPGAALELAAAQPGGRCSTATSPPTLESAGEVAEVLATGTAKEGD